MKDLTKRQRDNIDAMSEQERKVAIRDWTYQISYISLSATKAAEDKRAELKARIAYATRGRPRMIVTKRRAKGYPPAYEVSVNGFRVGGAHKSITGFGWYAYGYSTAIDIPHRNSWALGLSYQTLAEATEACLAYVRDCIQPKEKKK